MDKENKELTFEGAMLRLEEITRLLEKTDTPIDTSLELYKEGIELVKFCNSKLDDAQQKVAFLNQGAV